MNVFDHFYEETLYFIRKSQENRAKVKRMENFCIGKNSNKKKEKSQNIKLRQNNKFQLFPENLPKKFMP